MKFPHNCVALSLFAIASVVAEEFTINVGDTVSNGQPASGAGHLASAQESDVYLFSAAAGQLIFAESLIQDAAFGSNLRWQLIRPNGLTLFSSFFNNVQGRTVLPDSGVYKVRVFTDGSNAAWTGSYSFRIQPIPPDQTFQLTIGETISNGVPANGAGHLEVAGAEDRYTFDATAGDLIFFESRTQSVAFKQNLRWQLTKPNGLTIFSSFFTNPQGRVLLPDTGQYTLRIFTSGVDSEWFGDYSFRTLRISPDQKFEYTVGTIVTNGAPAMGAGLLEDPGSEDHYTFQGAAGQIVFFESLKQATNFAQNLRWQLIGPAGQTVFSSFFSNPQGRTVLPATGNYTIRIYTSATDPNWLGDYSFRTQGVSQDQIFPYTIGIVVSEGIPAPGAGNLEDPGSQDFFTFNGTEGQTIFFQSIGQAPAYQNNLRWQLIGPNNVIVFSSFFSNPQGRTVLPASGEYRIRIFTDGNQAQWVGPYSFSTREIGDQEIPIRIGEVISDGQPEEGAGSIEAPGSEDVYTFSSVAGEIVYFEAIEQAAAFQKNLRWQLLRPSGQPVFSTFFQDSESRNVMPETGTYKIRVYTDGNTPTWIGPYSFRTYARVFARPDTAATKPDRPVLIPVVKLLFNDVAENPGDSFQLGLPISSTVEGGTVVLQNNAVLYSPKAGFSGHDRFTYRILGEAGGTNDTIVYVAVTHMADDFANVINYKWSDNQSVIINLMAQPGSNYELQSSSDLTTWTPMRLLVGSTAEPMIFSFDVEKGVPSLYFRAPRTVGSLAVPRIVEFEKEGRTECLPK